MDRTAPKLATVFGGSGFVGNHLVQLLARKGYRVRVAVRRPDLAGEVRMFGGVGQVVPVQANLRNEDSIRRAVQGADVVINLVGVGQQSGQQSFQNVHVAGASAVARAAKAAGARALVHMSALGVDKAADVSAYAASKLAGEQAVLNAFPEAVILRPSLMFGQGDGFFNLMGTLARIAPVMPLIGGKTLFQPVFVGDVADALLKAAEGEVKSGRVYELGGPDVETHKALMTRILREAGRNRPLLALPKGIAKAMAAVIGFMPGKSLINGDQVELLHVDNVVSPEAQRDKRTFEAFGIVPASMADVLPTYMWRFRRHGQFDREQAGPDAGVTPGITS